MSLFQWMVGHGKIIQQLEELAEQLAAKCAGEVHPRLSNEALYMSVHELRGYVRARAALIVRRISTDAGRRHQISDRYQPGFQARVLDATVRRIQQQLHARSLMVHVRRAA